jgi:hypothetical protein
MTLEDLKALRARQNADLIDALRAAGVPDANLRPVRVALIEADERPIGLACGALGAAQSRARRAARLAAAGAR